MRLILTIVFLLLLPACKPPEINIRETPIKVTEQREGYGEMVRDGDYVVIDYTVTLPGGRQIMAHNDYKFQVGADTVIRGIDEAIVNMRIGGTRTFVCPPHKHWGRAGYGDGRIPPSTDLTIVMTLREIEGRTVRRIGSASN